ncbi:hypothetical protein P3T40_007920 [Paraburkholderia sp. EB58]|jgi:hypothetical protein
MSRNEGVDSRNYLPLHFYREKSIFYDPGRFTAEYGAPTDPR